MTIGFEGKVALVTGAGGGLGRAYALALAARGACVLVNDRGGARDGTGAGATAEMVAEEIHAAGGEALADASDVTDTDQVRTMVARAIDRWDRVDVLINNAGILRDRSFANLDAEDFDAVVRVHLTGSANVTRAVWPAMQAQRHGRILMTTSASALYGNFGQTNYGAAKLALVGLAKTLSLEGAKFDIRVNCISPIAATRMTEDIFPEQAAAALCIDDVVPAALYLVSDDAPTNAVVAAGGGLYHAAHITMTEGAVLPPDRRTPEAVAAAWSRIVARNGERVPRSADDQIRRILAALESDGEA
ncbi:SDR family NAD(P)-dependent oxidoreductase [Sphingomonas sanxanigenens]|uniref:Ketoreductase domain-containing protein n=1 Tax=Sphingomonas sanxanigenens DSM 19645 = NX02 TaxID=1123269 RepID=W0ABX6_9SPHN|nr:SDR family NAD(P)-dependent oxidoreductase [Sphingomonas sanxanigenens]AHE53818.1 hypothetical protein NX02_10505 [Sphingomonas sanxanigenens DSM 19645 = NX02]